MLRDEDKDSGDEEASNEKVVRYMVRLLTYSICFCLQSAIVSLDSIFIGATRAYLVMVFVSGY